MSALARANKGESGAPRAPLRWLSYRCAQSKRAQLLFVQSGRNQATSFGVPAAAAAASWAAAGVASETTIFRRKIVKGRKNTHLPGQHYDVSYVCEDAQRADGQTDDAVDGPVNCLERVKGVAPVGAWLGRRVGACRGGLRVDGGGKARKRAVCRCGRRCQVRDCGRQGRGLWARFKLTLGHVDGGRQAHVLCQVAANLANGLLKGEVHLVCWSQFGGAKSARLFVCFFARYKQLSKVLVVERLYYVVTKFALKV